MASGCTQILWSDIRSAIDILGKESNLDKSAHNTDILQRQLDVWLKQGDEPVSELRRNVQSLVTKVDQNASEFQKLSLMVQFYEQVNFADQVCSDVWFI